MTLDIGKYVTWLRRYYTEIFVFVGVIMVASSLLSIVTAPAGMFTVFQVLQMCIYIMSLILLLLIMTNAARARVTLQQIADRYHIEAEQGADA